MLLLLIVVVFAIHGYDVVIDIVDVIRDCVCGPCCDCVCGVLCCC